jgi:hypothetical protein
VITSLPEPPAVSFYPVPAGVDCMLPVPPTLMQPLVVHQCSWPGQVSRMQVTERRSLLLRLTLREPPGGEQALTAWQKPP